jgi:hypothetical protein
MEEPGMRVGSREKDGVIVRPGTGLTCEGTKDSDVAVALTGWKDGFPETERTQDDKATKEIIASIKHRRRDILRF